MTAPIELHITPFQAAHMRYGLDDLEDRFTHFWAALPADTDARLISRTRRHSFGPAQRALQAQADRLEVARGAPAFWRWRWLKEYRDAYRAYQKEGQPLAIDHYAIFWPGGNLQPAALQQQLRQVFHLPGVRQAPLDRLIPGRYAVEPTYLRPLTPGLHYLTVLTAWDTRGAWDLLSWMPLLFGQYELALAVDITTLRRDQAIRRTTDAWRVLSDTATDRNIKDARAERGVRDAEYALQRLDQQQLHEVCYALLLAAPTPDLLEEQAQEVQSSLGAHMRFERVYGAQGEYAKLFTPLPRGAIKAPTVERNTLSEMIAAKTPWTLRKSGRNQGLMFGYDRTEGLPILFDLWGETGFENAHLTMIGKAGSGKTVTLLALALRAAVAGTQVIFFDPVGKGRLLTKAIGPRGARYYDLGQQVALNLLDRVSDELSRQLTAVQRKLELALNIGRDQGQPRELNNFEKGVIDQALPGLYADPEVTPLLSDLVAALRSVEAPRARDIADSLATEIELLLLGSRAGVFNAATTLRWDFSSDVTVYNFQHLDPSMLSMIYDHGFTALDRFIESRPPDAPPVLVVMDEFGYMARVPALEGYVAWATKRWRNFRAAMWTADQNSTTYFGQEGLPAQWGPFITNNTLIKILMRQEGQEAEVLRTAYGDQLADEHISLIRAFGPGECIAMLGNTIHHLVFHLSELEENYFLPPPKETA